MRAWLAALCLFFILSSLARAQEVVVGGEVLMRLESPRQAEAVTRRIETQLERGADPEDIKVVKSKHGATIVWGSVTILEVTRALAATNQSDPLKLAVRWAENLHSLVGPGMIRLSQSRVVMPVGQAHTVEVGGLAEGPIQVDDPNGVVQAEVDASGAIALTGLRVGKTTLRVSRGKGKANLFIHVKDWAGTLPEQVAVQVVGDPAPGPVVAEGVLREAYVQARVRPGCTMSVGGDLAALPSVPRGQTMRLTVPVTIEGNENYYPVSKNLPVVVSSLDVEPEEANLLLVSNRPELVDVDGVLLRYKFSKNEPSRLMYSHKNISKGPRNLWVNLSNPNAEPVKVLVNTMAAGPSRNEVLVGHTSAVRFLESQGAGFVLTMPARSRLELATHELGPHALLTGFANLRILEGSSLELEVRTELAPSENDGKDLPDIGAPFNPFKIHPHGVFAQPYFEGEMEYRAGSPPVGVRFGEDPWLIDFETGLPNTGNFGVFYRLEATLVNPRPFPARVGLYFVPLNGPAAGTFLIDGQIYETPFRKARDAGGPPSPVTYFDLAPGQKKVVQLLTFPEASSSYPAELQWHDVTGRNEPSTAGPLQTPGGAEWK